MGMMQTNRRGFLAGVFGAVAVACGLKPKERLRSTDFKNLTMRYKGIPIEYTQLDHQRHIARRDRHHAEYVRFHGQRMPYLRMLDR